MKLRIDVLILAGVLVAGACVKGGDTIIDVSQGQGQTGSGPSEVTPSPGPQCAIARLDAGVESDVTTIGQGDTVNGGVILIGTQGAELASTCASQYAPQWTQPTPCVLSGQGYAISISAPASTPLDTVCATTVRVPGFAGTGSVSLRVVP